MINYAETYGIVTPESAEYGEAEDQGFIDESLESDFRDMVDLLEGTEPNCSDIDGASWFTAYDFGIDYSTGARESRSYHPKTERDLRYMIKAWKAAN